jgi:hypothetical protein
VGAVTQQPGRPPADAAEPQKSDKPTLAGVWTGLENNRWGITWRLEGQGNTFNGTYSSSDGFNTTMTAVMQGADTFEVAIIDGFKARFTFQCMLTSPTTATCKARRFFSSIVTNMTKQ